MDHALLALRSSLGSTWSMWSSPCASVEDLAAVRRRTDVQVAADESIQRAEDPVRAKKLGAVDAAILKVPVDGFLLVKGLEPDPALLAAATSDQVAAGGMRGRSESKYCARVARSTRRTLHNPSASCSGQLRLDRPEPLWTAGGALSPMRHRWSMPPMGVEHGCRPSHPGGSAPTGERTAAPSTKSSAGQDSHVHRPLRIRTDLPEETRIQNGPRRGAAVRHAGGYLQMNALLAIELPRWA
ncbi:hypothetical protein ACQPXM_11780 [Kribbella sp. CA-253562]|uniref:hypothetical protein n=1 Tax=Kribbella sp. CA-253562 TaxID=3239942 RepID=UPI003D8B93E5